MSPHLSWLLGCSTAEFYRWHKGKTKDEVVQSLALLLEMLRNPALPDGLETRKQAVDREAHATGGPTFDEQVAEREGEPFYSKSLVALVQPESRSPLPAASDAEGLIVRLAELYRKAATDAEGNVAEARARKDFTAAEANSVWAAAMRMAAKMADTALRNYRGDFSDGTDSPPATPGAKDRAPTSGGAQ